MGGQKKSAATRRFEKAIKKMASLDAGAAGGGQVKTAAIAADPFTRGYWHGRKATLAYIRDEIQRGTSIEACIRELEKTAAGGVA